MNAVDPSPRFAGLRALTGSFQGSRLFELARRGDLRLPAWLQDRGRRLAERVIYPAALLFFAMIAPFLAALLMVPLFVVLLLVRGDVDPDALSGAETALSLILGTFPLYLLVWGWLRLFERRGLASAGLELSGLARKYGRGLLIGLAMFGAAVALLALSGNLARAPETGSRATGGAVLLLFLAWVVQGGSEEVLSRGLMLPVFGTRFGSAAGIVISSLVFAASHLFNPNLSLIGLLNLFLFGVFASLYALHEGGLWGVFAVHSIWNWAQGNLFGFAVSGGDAGRAVIFGLVEVGPDWWTGGPFGPEGGLAVTAVLVVASALVLYLSRRRGSGGGSTIQQEP